MSDKYEIPIVSLNLHDAVLAFHALRHYERTHRRTPLKKGEKLKPHEHGHYDCPPQTREVTKRIYEAIKAADPDYHREFIGEIH